MRGTGWVGGERRRPYLGRLQPYLPACLPSCLPARLPARPPACLPACLPARLPACPPACPPACTTSALPTARPHALCSPLLPAHARAAGQPAGAAGRLAPGAGHERDAVQPERHLLHAGGRVLEGWGGCCVASTEAVAEVCAGARHGRAQSCAQRPTRRVWLAPPLPHPPSPSSPADTRGEPAARGGGGGGGGRCGSAPPGGATAGALVPRGRPDRGVGHEVPTARVCCGGRTVKWLGCGAEHLPAAACPPASPRRPAAQLYCLAERRVKGDGNCQFRALADQLYR